MNIFTRHEVVVLLLSLAVMLGTAKLLGELFTRYRLPAVIGEILGGIFLGPTLLGRIAPDAYQWLFPAKSHVFISLESMIFLGVVFLLFIAGLEVDLSSVLKQKKSVLTLSFLSILFPFAVGSTIAWFWPGLFGNGNNHLALTLFIGIALSITALPIIAKILMDLKLFHSDMGMLILSAAMINDLFGWLVFSVIIQLIETGSVNAHTLGYTVLLTLGIAVLILTVFKYLLNRAMPWIQAHTEWPGGVITTVTVVGLLFAALTEAIGIHAIFGAFLAGIAIGDSPHFKEHTKEIINQFINNIFAPLFFVSIGLRIDFIHHFSLPLFLLFTGIVFIGKMGGTVIAGRISKIKLRESLSLGAGMSASGAMGIILGIIALEYNIISQETFEAIVLMAVVTSLLSAPLMKFFLKSKEEIDILKMMEGKGFIPDMKGENISDVINEMASAASTLTGLSTELIYLKVLEREKLMSTGTRHGIAFPHAGFKELGKPRLIIGRSKNGIDFDAPDGKPAHIIFMILTPLEDRESQVHILAGLSRIFIHQKIVQAAVTAETYNEFISAIKTA